MKKVTVLLFIIFTLQLFAQDGLIISEVVDGANSGGVPKYVEIYNAHASSTYSLDGLQIRRYANGGTTPANINLDDVDLGPGEAWVVASAAFLPEWGGAFVTETPDQTSGTVSGNGDDVYELYNTGTTTVVDVYGVVGVDGTGEPWEYTDSQATRSSAINDGNNGTFNVSEWTITSYDNSTATPGNHGVDSPLPVELTSFSANASDRKVTLRWSTASEVDNQGFAILRAAGKEAAYEEMDSYVNNSALNGAGNSSQAIQYTWVDNSVMNGSTYWYKLVDVDVDGIRTEHGPVSATPNAVDVPADQRIPNAFYLTNYPNPFNPGTQIRFDLSAYEESNIEVNLTIYNALGEKVVTLYQGSVSNTAHHFDWNGQDAIGNSVPTGVYIYTLKSEKRVESNKMLLLR